MKRWLLFTFPDYYPAGGVGDLSGNYDTFEDAVAGANASAFKNKQVLDTKTGDIFDL